MDSEYSLSLGKTRKPDVTFHRKGKIDITALAAKQLSLHEGDVIDIAERKGEYLLYRKYKAGEKIGRHEAVVRGTNSHKHYCNNLRAYSRRLFKVVQKATGSEADVVRLPSGMVVNVNGLGKALTMITRNPL